MAACRQLAATLGLAVIGGIITTVDLATGFYVTTALCAVAAAATAWLLRPG